MARLRPMLLGLVVAYQVAHPTLAGAPQKSPTPAGAGQEGKAPYTATHDISHALAHPSLLGALGVDVIQSRSADPAKRAALVVQALVSELNLMPATALDKEAIASIRVSNGATLELRAAPAAHAVIEHTLQILRRLGDVKVELKGRLREVDDDFYAKLKNAKRVHWEEVERQFLAGTLKADPLDALFTLFQKQKIAAEGKPIVLEDGRSGFVVARQRAIQLLPSPRQIARKDKGPQTVLEGVSFFADTQVGSDRRYVRVKLTEKAAELAEARRLQVWVEQDKQVPAELAYLNETTQSRTEEIPDGGWTLVPVQHRPQELRDRKRWWVLAVGVRIIIEEEERMFAAQEMESAASLIVSDVLTHPGLRFFTSKRFALVDSKAWKWPKELRPKVAGFEQVAADAEGPLLRIGIQRYEPSGKDSADLLVSVALEAREAAVAGAPLLVRYLARRDGEGWKLQLAAADQ